MKKKLVLGIAGILILAALIVTSVIVFNSGALSTISTQGCDRIPIMNGEHHVQNADELSAISNQIITEDDYDSLNIEEGTDGLYIRACPLETQITGETQ